jgi:hypothetical protein
MQSAFAWTTAGGTLPSGSRRRHVTGGVTVTAEPEGDTYTVLTPDGSQLVQDVRGVWLAVEVLTTAPGGLPGVLGGEGLPFGRVWLDLLTSAEIEYQPDAALADLSIPVVPDLGDKATLMAIVTGTITPGVDRLRLRSRLRYAPGNPVLVALATASPYLALDI